MAITTRSKFWGPMFPDVWDAGKRFWGPHFPDPGPELDLVTGNGPAGVATFVIDLDSPMDVTHEWHTDVFKAYNGEEKRAAILDNPRRRFKGSALLIGGASVRTLRTQFARWAASGATFRLGLPFEALLLAADSVGTSVTVGPTAIANCDWANPGQRVVVMSSSRTAVEAVVQSAAGTSIVLDVAPGVIGKAGGVIMPSVAVYLEPQQNFARYCNADGIERWSIDAVAAEFGFKKSPRYAMLDLETVTGGGGLEGVTVLARVAGIAGNDIRVSLDADSLAGIDFTEVGTDIAIHFDSGVSTVGDLVAAINAGSTLIKMVGFWDPDQPIADPDDEFAFTNLDGGSDGDYASDGNGAVVATHATRPAFDRGLVVKETSADSLQAMNEVVNLGGIPANVGQADASDWSRSIAMLARWGAEWQWVKKFFATVRGRQRAFWLPTYRRDLVSVASGVNTLTIEGPSDEAGGFFIWYQTKQDIFIEQADGTKTRATISNAVDNGDGTITLTIGVTLSGSPITMVSWLELCRFEDDAISVRFHGHLFQIATTARVVRR